MSVTQLKKAVKKRNSDFPLGTVIKWKSAGMYLYAAIRTPIGWSTTARPGNVYVPQTLSWEGLLKIMERPETSDVQVSDTWKEIG